MTATFTYAKLGKINSVDPRRKLIQMRQHHNIQIIQQIQVKTTPDQPVPEIPGSTIQEVPSVTPTDPGKAHTSQICTDRKR